MEKAEEAMIDRVIAKHLPRKEQLRILKQWKQFREECEDEIARKAMAKMVKWLKKNLKPKKKKKRG